MSTFIKKNWFICLLVAALACVSAYVIYDENHGKLKGKKIDGHDIVYSVNDQNYTAADFYDQLSSFTGSSPVGQLFVKSICQNIETTDEMKTTAAAQAQSIITSYSSQYPTNYRQLLNTALMSAGYSGYDELETYLTDYLKQNQILREYCEAHFDELQIRSISYILIKFEDEPTPEGEPSKIEEISLHEVDASLEHGESFEDVAKQYSQDTTTAPKGGLLGTIDNRVSNLDSAFLKAALELEEGEVSDWVYSENFGYFRIKNNASTPEALETFVNKDNLDGTYTDPYSTLFSENDTTLAGTAIWLKAEEFGYDLNGDADLEAQIKAYLGV